MDRSLDEIVAERQVGRTATVCNTMLMPDSVLVIEVGVEEDPLHAEAATATLATASERYIFPSRPTYSVS
jgi:hypothetical protein